MVALSNILFSMVSGSGIEKILYMPSERALKMLSFDSNTRCIGSRGGVGEHTLGRSSKIEGTSRGRNF